MRVRFSLYRFLSMVVSGFFLSACSTTNMGDAPANMVVAAGAELTDVSDIDRPNWMRDVPRCHRRLGTIALYETDQDMQAPYGPQNATPMLRYLLQRSGCFTVLDRSPALTKLEGELRYDPNAATMLSQAANVPPGEGVTAQPSSAPVAVLPFRRADYLLTARVIFQEVLSNDISFAGTASSPSIPGHSAFGGGANLALSNRRTEVNVVLFLTDMRTSVQVLTEQGSAAKIDRTTSSFGGFYIDNLNSKTAAAALYDAYARFVMRLNSDLSDVKKKAAASRP
jgi:curli biogenesis system outer membrane secretion channel CsgG